MKLKYFALAAAFVSCVVTANARQTEEFEGNFWVGANGGVISTYTNHFNKPQPYVGIEFGTWISPVFGARLGVAGLSQYFDEQAGVWYVHNVSQWSKKQPFCEFNLDGIVNFSKVFSKNCHPLVDIYLFLGPTLNIATQCSEFTGTILEDGVYEVRESDALRARAGLTGGLGVGFNLSRRCNLGLEWRSAVAPSVFGDASIWNKAELTNRLSIHFAYSFGSRRHEKCCCKEQHETAAASTAVNTVETVVTKEIIKEVEKVIEKTAVSGNFIFFPIGKSSLTNADKVRLSEVARAIKEADSSVVYYISGYADKSTGSVAYNKKLSENRAKNVYDYLVAEGVSPEQLEIVVNGGVNAMFFGEDYLSRVCIISSEK